MSDPGRWTTFDEATFLRATAARSPEAETFLRGYIATARTRTEWGDVSRRVVLSIARVLLAEVRSGRMS